ncbi:hypothetical protein [[Mycobacterium] burgundiense]|uniref:DUF3090 family protein n=1 Tax=[Mycobacterium] burgundiense TaxID=3064286 RepID=A0ABM9LV93_9MYCO|nr:hypothetical protein [Mycolicibacterium sp. MU0053]CAJ1505301.1 hypothetical protein MU0053_002900 [Mycolicibacterium sp. MU0053]
MIVDLQAIDPDLVVLEVTTSLGDLSVTVDTSREELRPMVYRRIDDATDDALRTCVVCGALAHAPAEPVPTRCEDHTAPGTPR